MSLTKIGESRDTVNTDLTMLIMPYQFESDNNSQEDQTANYLDLNL